MRVTVYWQTRQVNFLARTSGAWIPAASYANPQRATASRKPRQTSHPTIPRSVPLRRQSPHKSSSFPFSKPLPQQQALRIGSSTMLPPPKPYTTSTVLNTPQTTIQHRTPLQNPIIAAQNKSPQAIPHRASTSHYMQQQLEVWLTPPRRCSRSRYSTKLSKTKDAANLRPAASHLARV